MLGSLLIGVLVLPAAGQPPVQLAPGTTLFRLDLAGTPVGEVPATIRLLKGNMEVVLQGGVPMLKASAASEFLITLPQVLPRDFTLEFDLVPKQGSNPQDLSFEGTPTINQGTGSAHLLWHATGYLTVIGGGGDTYESPMPETLRASLPGVLTHVVADFQGPTVKLYTNGQRHYTLDKQFARGRVLRVFLGAQDDGTEAVYLAGLRISTGSGLGIVAATAGLPVVGPTPAPQPQVTGNPQPQTASQSSGMTGTLSSAVTPIVTVKQGTTGPIVDWTPVISPGSYAVQRWKLNDALCCNNTSPALTSPPWQDSPVSLIGTYVYQVTLTTKSGVATGQTQFQYTGVSPISVAGSGTVASTAPPPPPPATAVTVPASTGAVSGPIAATGPAPAALTTLAVTAVTAPSPYLGYTEVRWNLAPGAYTITFKRWKSDDPTCCNYSSTSGAFTSPPWLDPLVANGALPGTYVYEITANLPSGPLQGRASYTIPAQALLATQPSGTAVVSPPPSTPVTAPTTVPAGVPTLSTPPPLPGSISPIPAAPPPVSTYLTGTPAWVRVNWSMASGTPRGMLYNVERYLESNPGCCVVRATGLANIGWTDEATQWPGTYVYTVTAVYPDGSTGSIEAKWVRPDPVNPANFRGTPSTGQVILQWDPVPNVDWYYLFGPEVPYGSFAITPPVTHFVVRGLAPGTYTWTIGSYYSSPKAPAPVSTAASAFPTVTVTVP